MTFLSEHLYQVDLFYETYDGYNFRSIDKLFTQKPKRKYAYTEIIGEVPVGYDGVLLEFPSTGAINLNDSIVSGAFTNIRKQTYDRMKGTYSENSHSSKNSYFEYNNTAHFIICGYNVLRTII